MGTSDWLAAEMVWCGTAVHPAVPIRGVGRDLDCDTVPRYSNERDLQLFRDGKS